jgi:AcrR family transcriptional regulator
METPQLTEAQDTKDRILLGAQQLFMRRGIKSVSMDDIVAALGISKKTLYKWFETKDQLVQAVMSGHLIHSEGDCRRMAQEAENAVHEIVLMMKWTKQEHSDVHPGIFMEMKKYHAAAYEQWHRHKFEYILKQIEQNLRRGIAEGLYRAEIDVPVLARLHLGAIDVVMDPDLFPPRQFPTARVMHVTDEGFLRSVVTPAGLDMMNRYLGLAAAQ